MQLTSIVSLALCAAMQPVLGLSIPGQLQARAVGDPWVFDGTGHYNLTLPNDRWALVHRKPYTFDNTKAHPLIIAFHGGGADAGNQEAISNLSNNSLTINGQDLVVIYPQGTVGATGTRSFNGAPYSATGIDDIANVLNIVDAAKANLNIDPLRIYAVGFSQGAGFVNLLACTPASANVFAAYSMNSAAIYEGTKSYGGCDPGGNQISIINFHGLDDGVIPFAGRTNRNGNVAYKLPSQESWRQAWAERGGCKPPPVGSVIAPTVITQNYAGINATGYRWNCPQSTVVAYTVQTMAHFWLTKAQGYFDETPANIMTFFNARPKGKLFLNPGKGDAR